VFAPVWRKDDEKNTMTFASITARRMRGKLRRRAVAEEHFREDRRLDLPMFVMPWFVIGMDALIVIST
jgi:hypothetical protein